MEVVSTLQLVALLGLLGSAVYWDLKERRIPNNVTVPGLLIGLVLAAFASGGFPSAALAGAGVAFLISVPLMAMGGIGGGDVKLLTAVGAYVGIGGLLSVLIFGGMAGGVIALVNAAERGALLGVLVNVKNLVLHQVTLGRRGERIRLDSPGAHTVPYGLAIAAGALGAWFFPLSFMGGGP